MEVRRLDQIEARHIAWHDSFPNIAEWSDLHGALSSTAGATADELAMAWELARNDVPALVAALRAVLEEIDKRGKQAREALPPSLAALAVPSYQFNVRASDVIRAIEEALA